MTDEMFINEMKILWQNLDIQKRGKLGRLIRDYFGIERGSKVIEKMQESLCISLGNQFPLKLYQMNYRRQQMNDPKLSNETIKQELDDRPICPDNPAHGPMMRNGKRWVGRGQQRQKWLCNTCGAPAETKINTGGI